MANGPSHEVPLLSAASILTRAPSVAAQALQRQEDGRWIISVVGPAGHMQLLPDEAQAIAEAMLRAHADYVRLSGHLDT